jgi:phage terminase large subunit-like protein
VSTVTRPRRRRAAAPPTRPPWWGAGEAPLALWPGVTIEMPATWSRAHARWESPDGQYYFDLAAADRAVAFFPTFFTHHIGEFAGQPFTLLPYQAKLLTRPFFGWKRASDGLRRFRKIFAFLPKGAGKSPWGAGTGIYLTVCDNEPAAETYAVAGDKKQARIVFDNAKVLVETSPDLLEVCEPLRDSLYFSDTRSTYQVLSSDASTKHGFRPSAVIFDELHNQRNRNLYEALKKSMVKRRQPAMIIITHAGEDDESLCYEEYEYAKGVLAGSLEDDTCLPVIFEAGPDDDWADPAVWARVNPGHGITVKHDGLVQECAEALAEPRKRADFRRFHLNQWVSAATTWVPLEWWDACDEAVPSDAELVRQACALGIDMSQKIDLTAAVAVFRLPLAADETPIELEVKVEDEAAGELVTTTHSLNYRIAIVPMAWLPEETLRERVERDRVQYDVWRDQKFLRATEGAIIDADAVVRWITGGPDDLVKRFPLMKQAQVGYDPAFATEIAVELGRRGFTCVEVLQNYKHMNEPCQAFEALVKAKRVLHGANPLLRWTLGNTAIRRDDAGRIRPVKPRKATKRIDPIVAVLMALSRLMATPDTTAPGPVVRILSW